MAESAKGAAILTKYRLIRGHILPLQYLQSIDNPGTILYLHRLHVTQISSALSPDSGRSEC